MKTIRKLTCLLLVALLLTACGETPPPHSLSRISGRS